MKTPEQNAMFQIAEVIRAQDEIGKGSLVKIKEKLREMNAKILENANQVIAKDVNFDIRLEGCLSNIQMAIQRKRELEELNAVLVDEFK